MLEKIMQNKAELGKVCDNLAKKRQLCDNFATTKKRKNSNEIIRDIYIFKEVVATFFWLVPISDPLFFWKSGRSD